MEKLILAMGVGFLSIIWGMGCNQNTANHASPGPDYFAKLYFNSKYKSQTLGDQEWWYRKTVIDTPSNTSALTVGDGHWLHPEVVRFEITKDYLVGWRSDPLVLTQNKSPATKGAPVLAYKILHHFDFDKSKSWQDREFIKIDFSKNYVKNLFRKDSAEGVNNTNIVNSTTYLIDNSKISDPKRLRTYANYFEFVVRHPIANSMKSYGGGYSKAYQEKSAAPIIDIRYSFMKKKHSDYIPTNYPDFIKNKQDKKININDRFGFFRVNFNGKSQYNNITGLYSKNKVQNATLFNIWQKSRNNHGEIISINKRNTKEIIYYTNLYHPEYLLETTLKVGQAWDKILRKTVFFAQGKKYNHIDEVPKIFNIQRNNCNINHVSNLLENKFYKTRERVEEAADIKLLDVKNSLQNAQNSGLSFSQMRKLERQSLFQLEKICSALEYFTQNSAEKFVYQRPGDIRFNLINLVGENKTTSYSGYGPMLADPVTGEIISATAYINLKYLEERAGKIASQINLIDAKNLGLQAIFGSGVSNNLDQNSVKLVRERAKSKTNINFDISNNIAEKIDAKFFATDTKLNKSKINSGREQLHDSLEFVNSMTTGFALKYKNLNYTKRFTNIMQDIYFAVLAHEFGHNLGLQHNMAGAADSLNYHRDFWYYEGLPENIQIAKIKIKNKNILSQLESCEKNYQENKSYFNLINSSKNITTQDCLLQKTGMYASIMDYGATPLAHTHGLGAYDQAAIMFAYGKQVEVFDQKLLKINPEKNKLSKWLSLNNYKHIPKILFANRTDIHQRSYEKFDWEKILNKDNFPAHAVPYLYCNDPRGVKNYNCLAFDFGPTVSASASWHRQQFFNNYVFSQFARDQDWSQQKYINQAIFQEKQIIDRIILRAQWYAKLVNSDPDFKKSYLEKDFLKALAIGINHIAQIIAMPEPGTHITTPNWVVAEHQEYIEPGKLLEPANFLVSLKKLNNCDTKSISKIESEKIVGLRKFRTFEVPIGVGRPYYSRFTEEKESNSQLYIGSSFIKKYALIALIKPYYITSLTNISKKKELSYVSLYQLFPEAVEYILGAVINNKLEKIGYQVDLDKNKIKYRELIDLKNLKFKTQQDFDPVLLPKIDDELRLLALRGAKVFKPQEEYLGLSMLKSLHISWAGSRFEKKYELTEDDSKIINFTHLTQDSYFALKNTQGQSIGAQLLTAAQNQKDRVARLKSCIDEPNIRMLDPLCFCVSTQERKSFDNWQCREQPILQPVGEGSCSLEHLEEKYSQSVDQLYRLVGFIDHVRVVTTED